MTVAKREKKEPLAVARLGPSAGLSAVNRIESVKHFSNADYVYKANHQQHQLRLFFPTGFLSERSIAVSSCVNEVSNTIRGSAIVIEDYADVAPVVATRTSRVPLARGRRVIRVSGSRHLLREVELAERTLSHHVHEVSVR